jgi:hypothetical protein
MIERGSASDKDMVIAFLKAEIDSPRFGPTYQDILIRSGLDRTLIVDQANLENMKENRIRAELLKLVRGYTANQFLFTGFPQNAQWRRADLEPTELHRLKYANFETWTTLSGGSRLVVDGAQNIDTIQTGENADANIKAVAEQLKLGNRYPELIVVQGQGEDLIIVEGHTRATAYVLAEHAEPIPLLIGTSPHLRQWAFY